MHLAGSTTSGRQAAEQAERIGAELPAAIDDALRTARGVEAYNVDVKTGLETATRDYVEAVTKAASEGKPLPDAKPLATARAATAAAETAAEAVRQADYAASIRLEQVVAANADALVQAVKPIHDRAVERLREAAEAIPPNCQDAEAALMSGAGDAWRQAVQALDVMAECQTVRQRLHRYNAEDPGNEYAEIRNYGDYSVGTWPTERIPRCVSLTKAAAEWWLPTAAEQQARAREVAEARKAKRQAETVDPRRQVEAEVAAQAKEYFDAELAARKAKPAA